MDEMLGLLDIAIQEFGLEPRADVSEYHSSREVGSTDPHVYVNADEERGTRS